MHWLQQNKQCFFSVQRQRHLTEHCNRTAPLFALFVCLIKLFSSLRNRNTSNTQQTAPGPHHRSTAPQPHALD
jgi:hypothetical protein